MVKMSLDKNNIAVVLCGGGGGGGVGWGDGAPFGGGGGVLECVVGVGGLNPKL